MDALLLIVQLTMARNSCLCRTKVEESVVFTDISALSKEDVLSQLFIGALGPHPDSTPTVINDSLTVYHVGSIDEDTVFEVKDKGRTFLLKNIVQTVNVEGWTMTPQLHEAEAAVTSNAIVKSSIAATGGSYVEFGGASSSIEWTISNVPSTGKYLMSFRYGLDTSPKPLIVEVNGVAVQNSPLHNETSLHYLGNSPPAEALPLQRCEGDCDNDGQCDDGLYCQQNDGLEKVPGCVSHSFLRIRSCPTYLGRS